MPPSQPPMLWHFAISHYTEKARWALDHKGIAHHRRLGFLDYPVRNALRTGQLRLPVLFHEGRTLCDSTRIIAYLEALQPQPALYPADARERQRALELEDFFDEEVGAHLRAVLVHAMFRDGADATVEAFGMGQGPGPKRLLRALLPAFRVAYSWRHRINPRDVEIGWQKLQQGLAKLEAEVRPSGYLVGDRFSVADLTAAALLYPLALPDEYPYDFPESFRGVVSQVLERVEAKFACEWITRIYRMHRGRSVAIRG